MKTNQPTPERIDSFKLLRQVSSKIGKELGFGSASSFAVLKGSLQPQDLLAEWAIEELAAIKGIAKKQPGEATRRLSSLKRVVDVFLTTEAALKANMLAASTAQEVEHPSQLKPEVELEDGDPTTQTNPLANQFAEAGGSVLGKTLDGLAVMAGIEQVADPQNTEVEVEGTPESTVATGTQVDPKAGELENEESSMFPPDLNQERKSEAKRGATQKAVADERDKKRAEAEAIRNRGRSMRVV